MKARSNRNNYYSMIFKAPMNGRQLLGLWDKGQGLWVNARLCRCARNEGYLVAMTKTLSPMNRALTKTNSWRL